MQSIAPADGRVRRESYHGQRGPSRLSINKGVNRRAIRNIPSPAPAPTDSKKMPPSAADIIIDALFLLGKAAKATSRPVATWARVWGRRLP